jgi:hypothetical protein
VANKIQRSFAGGEVAPELQARTDLSRFAIGLKTLRNMFVLRAGGATKRTGTQFVDITGSTDQYKVHTFGPGTPWVFSDAFNVTTLGNGKIRVLVVAGGGSGGSVDGTGVTGGGGGGGGVIDTNLTLGATGSYAIGIGAGGVTNFADHTIGIGSASGNPGGNSTAFGLTAIGGGKGDSHDLSAGGPTSNGGSGGGAMGTQEDTHIPPLGTTVSLTTGGTGTVGQGQNGGHSQRDPRPAGAADFGGGGGGAGEAGHDGLVTTAPSSSGGPDLPGGGDGKGGAGIASDISGTPTYYGGGGGGGCMNGGAGAAGGLGGGGQGGPVHGGTNGTGGGGGGGSGATFNSGGAGGHGIVIVRYLVSTGIVATGGTITLVPA